MNYSKLPHIAVAFVMFFAGSYFVYAQPSQSLIKKTITKTDSFEFGAGGTVAVTGAPEGSIRVVGNSKNEIEITARIELQAANEADFNKLIPVTGFLTDETIGRTGIISFGTFKKLGEKKLWKKFPKNLMGLPLRIDYIISVPRFCDLEIDGGKGDLSITGVEGSLRINFLETNADILAGVGATNITVGSGSVTVALGVNGWRGRAANISIGSGDLSVKLPSSASAEIDATILRTGSIENLLPDLKARDRKIPFTEKSIMAKVGVGGSSLKFTVGDGTLKLMRLAD
ncbi:MAG: hypothetical protein ACKVRN_05025 [Pyrinomonadaceae bacterium]